MKAESKKLILWFNEIRHIDVELVGGKNSSLGEMYSQLTKKGINIPDGFVVTSEAYRYFLKANNIDEKLSNIFAEFDPNDLQSLKNTGSRARNLILKACFPKDLKSEIVKNYKKLSEKYKEKNIGVAARSSGTAEDLKTASFAGQHETYLNVIGEEMLLKAVRKCMASMFSDRVIAYREEKGFPHLTIALSVGVQKMVRSDLASSGIMFTIDTETGFPNVVLINSIWGIGEMIVKGKITPDEFYVFKPTLEKGYNSIITKDLGRKNKKYIYRTKGGLKEVKVDPKCQLKFSITDKEILTLAKWGCLIEKHYGTPQDIEWAKDGKSGQLFIVQSRPETVHISKEINTYKEYHIKTKKSPILKGIAVGDKIGIGKARIIFDVAGISRFKKGEVLVTKMTDPDWVPIMRLASAIVTDEGGKACHAAIIARELGIPTIVGSHKATKVIKNGSVITVDCTQGLDGRIYSGKVEFDVKKYNLGKILKPKTKIMINIGAPDIAFRTSFLPNDGVGLAREEFIIAEKIRIHPLALCNFSKIKDKKLKQKIEFITAGYKDKKEYFINKLAEGIAQIAAAFYPKEVIVRFSDFKTNEYRNLIGGELFEQTEYNPMMGFRGASRYLDKEFQPAFRMECAAIKKVYECFGLENINVMVPFCRTVDEGKKVMELIKNFGLNNAINRNITGAKRLKVYVMCEIPSNVILAEDFLEIFDGMSIGSNDLTQLTLGIDRDNAKIAYISDERNRAVKELIGKAIKSCRKKKKYCGICGQAPSDFLEFSEFLIKEGIESISLNPGTVIKTILSLSKKKP